MCKVDGKTRTLVWNPCATNLRVLRLGFLGLITNQWKQYRPITDHMVYLNLEYEQFFFIIINQSTLMKISMSGLQSCILIHWSLLLR